MIVTVLAKIHFFTFKLLEMNRIIKKLESIENMLIRQTLVNKEVLCFKEAAVYVGLSRSHLYHLIGENKIQAYKPNDGKLYFKRLDLYNWMLSKKKAVSQQSNKARRN